MNKKMLFGGVVLFLIGLVVFNNPPSSCAGLGCPPPTFLLPVIGSGVTIAIIGIVLFVFGLLYRHKNIVLKLGVSAILAALFIVAFFNDYLSISQLQLRSYGVPINYEVNNGTPQNISPYIHYYPLDNSNRKMISDPSL